MANDKDANQAQPSERRDDIDGKTLLGVLAELIEKIAPSESKDKHSRNRFRKTSSNNTRDSRDRDDDPDDCIIDPILLEDIIGIIRDLKDRQDVSNNRLEKIQKVLGEVINLLHKVYSNRRNVSSNTNLPSLVEPRKSSIWSDWGL